ncbi:MAG: translation initiation factor IF-2 [Armatimonadetes bacterium]|nr:translation initiation factor IF-2 [Armatimonadota bacterium]
MRNNDLLRLLTELGVRVKNQNANLDPKTVQVIRERARTNAAARESARVPVQRGSVEIYDGILIRELADRMGVSSAEIQKVLIKQGILANLNQPLGEEMAFQVAEQMGFEPTAPEANGQKGPSVGTSKEGTAPRPPVVTIMGHVDHGKTTLLDSIRETKVVDSEFGGITQHIGAYQVEVDGRRITFLDTPGHEAFTAMRARGALVTDVAVLVVAADDGIMPQTIEAIHHAKAAGVPILVAVNKVDRDGADPQRVRQQLTEHGLIPDEWGGDTIMVDLSALKKQGLEDLLTAILVLAEDLSLRADPYQKATGVIVEAEMDRGRGPVATVLVQNGTLKAGEAIVAGTSYGRIKAMLDETGKKVAKAGPATPVEISGLNSVPQAGEPFEVFADDKTARQIALGRAMSQREETLTARQRVSLTDLYSQVQEGSLKDLNLVLKADVQGSLEALRGSLATLANEEVRVQIVHTGVGPITESDVLLAAASNAIVIAFNVRVEPDAKRAADVDGVDVRTYKVIYDVINEIRSALTGMLAPVFEEVKLGTVQVRATFRTPRGIVAGCYITDGVARRNADVRVIRDGQVIHTGKMASLRHVKDDVRELAAGFECGILLDGFNDVREEDILEVFTMQEVRRAA